MQILSGWTRQRLSKCDCEGERHGGPQVVAALRNLSQKNIMLRSKDKQWTSNLLSRRIGSISFLFLLLLSPAAAAAVPGFPRSANASLAFSVCSTNKPSSKRRADPHIPLRIAARSFLRLFSLRLISPVLSHSGRR